METFLESQFDWCPQVWIFTAELSIINLSLHERALRTVYFDYTPSFEGLLNKDNSFSIHEKKNIYSKFSYRNFQVSERIISKVLE